MDKPAGQERRQAGRQLWDELNAFAEAAVPAADSPPAGTPRGASSASDEIAVRGPLSSQRSELRHELLMFFLGYEVWL